MPRHVDHEQRRAEIVQGVWAVIAEHGIEAVTMRRVADAAGVSVGRIQHYFTSRVELVRASARAMVAAAESRHDGAALDPSSALRHAVTHVIPQTEVHRVGVTIWLAYVAASVGDPELARILAEAKRGQEDEIAHLLSAVTPRLDDDVARPQARELVALADGLATRVVIGDLTGDEALATMEARWLQVLPTADTDTTDIDRPRR